MTTSILDTIKKLLGFEKDYTAFDLDIMTHINAAFLSLQQIGVGPKKGYSISGPENEWGEFLSNGPLLDSVKSYMYVKVRLLFDPPTMASVLTSMENLVKELEWRLNHEAEKVVLFHE